MQRVPGRETRGNERAVHAGQGPGLRWRSGRIREQESSRDEPPHGVDGQDHPGKGECNGADLGEDGSCPWHEVLQPSDRSGMSPEPDAAHQSDEQKLTDDDPD